MTTKYEQAAANRAKLLRYIQRHPGAVLADIENHMELPKSRVAQYLLRMENLGEIRRVSGGVSSHGRACAKCYAIAKQTIRASSVVKIVAANLQGNGEATRQRLLSRGRKRFVSSAAPRLFGGL